MFASLSPLKTLPTGPDVLANVLFSSHCTVPHSIVGKLIELPYLLEYNILCKLYLDVKCINRMYETLFWTTRGSECWDVNS